MHDPRVLAIKMTLYRTSSDSPFVPALIHAAETGKQVAVLVEIKARFDEQRNLELAQRLGKSRRARRVRIGRFENPHQAGDGGARRARGACAPTATSAPATTTAGPRALHRPGFIHLQPGITDDVIDLFHFLTGRSLKRDYRKLLVAPVNMRDRFLSKIRREIEHAKNGRGGKIIAKMNALQDPKIITSLYEASHAGVQIDLIVRGFCCLRPKVPGLSDNIRIYSILGRFLEHSRIFWFQNDASTPGTDEYYIGSADWMYRNLDFRVEAITPVEDPLLRDRLKEILDTMLADRGHAWELEADGTWLRRTNPDGRPVSDTQDLLMSRFLRTAKKSRQGR